LSQIIDIGTGYYVEKDIAASKEYFSKKVKFVTEQMEKVQVGGSRVTVVSSTYSDPCVQIGQHFAILGKKRFSTFWKLIIASSPEAGSETV
jgi:prefoldin subunit 5